MNPERIAQQFHETYERLAPEFAYVTRTSSAVPWAEVPEKNKELMIAVCKEIFSLPEDPEIDQMCSGLTKIAKQFPKQGMRYRLLLKATDKLCAWVGLARLYKQEYHRLRDKGFRFLGPSDTVTGDNPQVYFAPGISCEDPNYVPQRMKGEKCRMCKEAEPERKVEEVVFREDPTFPRHPYAANVCINCFKAIMGDWVR